MSYTLIQRNLLWSFERIMNTPFKGRALSIAPSLKLKKKRYTTQYTFTKYISVNFSDIGVFLVILVYIWWYWCIFGDIGVFLVILVYFWWYWGIFGDIGVFLVILVYFWCIGVFCVILVNFWWYWCIFGVGLYFCTFWFILLYFLVYTFVLFGLYFCTFWFILLYLKIPSCNVYGRPFKALVHPTKSGSWNYGPTSMAYSVVGGGWYPLFLVCMVWLLKANWGN